MFAIWQALLCFSASTKAIGSVIILFTRTIHSERGKSAREQINGLALLAIVWNMEVTDLVTRIFGEKERQAHPIPGQVVENEKVVSFNMGKVEGFLTAIQH